MQTQLAPQPGLTLHPLREAFHILDNGTRAEGSGSVYFTDKSMALLYISIKPSPGPAHPSFLSHSVLS